MALKGHALFIGILIYILKEILKSLKIITRMAENPLVDPDP